MWLPSPEDLEDSVVWSVIRVAHVLEREVTALFAGFDLSPVQFGVLSHLGANGPMTTSALARSVLVRPQSLTGVITSLEGRGIVERPGVRGRGRASPVALTTAGQQLLAKVWPAFVTADEAITRGLPEQQAAAFTATLHRLLQPGLITRSFPQGDLTDLVHRSAVAGWPVAQAPDPTSPS